MAHDASCMSPDTDREVLPAESAYHLLSRSRIFILEIVDHACSGSDTVVRFLESVGVQPLILKRPEFAEAKAGEVVKERGPRITGAICQSIELASIVAKQNGVVFAIDPVVIRWCIEQHLACNKWVLCTTVIDALPILQQMFGGQ